MKKQVALFTVAIFALSMIAHAGAFEEGLKYLKLARKAKINENINEETGFLQKAFKEFKRSQSDESLLPLFYTGLRLNRESEFDRPAAEFIKKARTGFLQSVFQCVFLNLDEKQYLSEYLSGINGRIPFMEDFAIKENGFHPYRRENPAVGFTLLADAACSFKLDGNKIQEVQFRKGEVLFPFPWQEDFFGKPLLIATFESKNMLTSYSVNKNFMLFMDMPEGLYYESGSFGIKGKEFKKETKTVRKRNVFYLLGALLVGSGAFAKKTPDATGIASKSSTFIALSAIMIGGYFFITKNSIGPDKKNIKFNRELTDEIEKRKSDIKVNIEIEEE